jgi:hypothetical protein
MKLYTEEEIRKVLHPDLFHLILPRMTPIELPSDEEISKEASNNHYGTNFKHVFASGAKWMKEQILNQNK